MPEDKTYMIEIDGQYIKMTTDQYNKYIDKKLEDAAFEFENDNDFIYDELIERLAISNPDIRDVVKTELKQKYTFIIKER